MKIKDKIMLDREGLEQYGPINIVVFGDSVSHGSVNGYYDYENVYWNILKQRLHKFRDYMPVNMINASVGGTSAAASLARMENQVLCHRPDAVIVCFGLNDVNGTLEEYLSSLKVIFEGCKEHNCETVFMTPNMLNTYVADDTPSEYRDYAFKTAEMQNSGRMDKYIYSAVALAEKMNIKVCDCYSEWKRLSETEDTTLLLANRINHPIPKMHRLFADKLYELFMGEVQNTVGSDSGMLENV